MLSENIAPSHADLNPYRFFLYLVEPAAYATAFGDEPYAVSSEEFICEGICMSVTQAVYVPTGAPSAHIEGGLSEVLSLMTLEQILQQRADFAAAETPIDTSAWPTFSSPLGFDIKYPPGWLAKEFETPNMVRFFNEKAQAEHTRREAEGINEFDSYEDGVAWIEISPGPDRPFNVDSLSSNCGGTSSTTELAGRPAVRCGGLFWMETPSGTIVQVIRVAIEADLETHGLLDAALATITFHE